jgi:four helix bundle protein
LGSRTAKEKKYGERSVGCWVNGKDEEYKNIQERTFEFALLIIEFYRFLVYEKKEYVLSKQMLKSGTSIGANIQEAQAAQSKKDFIAKMSIASKESREANYWLVLLDRSGYMDGFSERAKLFSEIEAIMNISTKIVKTSVERYEVYSKVVDRQ